ncbi:MAG: HAD-IC family P-type ATPase, partial [Rickettsiales bacterium]|nr:HAD-IC family P-type ATPase [Rickettsiales bacterium]
FIFIVLLINAVIGTIQEFSAQKSATALQKMVPAFATVLRDGKAVNINTEYIVPGDVIHLESGNKVPADIKLIHTQNLSIDESLLTGESVAITKDSKASPAEDVPLGERSNMAFAGTMVARGRGRGEVIATARNTEIGHIAGALNRNILIKPPLLLRIEQFTIKLMVAMMGVIVIMFAVSLLQGGNLLELFMIAVALAVAAIPEGLPVAITVALSVGMRRMATRSVIVRKLLAVESLGSCTFIASDKTGTLTVNELTARRILLPDGIDFDVTGEGITPKGEVIPSNGNTKTLPRLARLVHTAILTNEGSLHCSEAEWTAEGDMVDVSLLVLGEKYGLKRDVLTEQYPEIVRVPYESEHGFSASVHRYENELVAYVKGAPERILAMCSQMETVDGDRPLHRAQVEAQMAKLAEAGYRVLAFAQGMMPENMTTSGLPEHLHDLTFLGFVGMIDPLRSEAREAVDLCRQAGIEVAMITGDHPLTARAIAIDLGLGGKNIKVVTGKEIREAQEKGQKELEKLIESCRVFARIEPAQKKEIVEALTHAGHFVAVTGDGVNDAPALKHAHVGVAMGKRGTDVARESADLIITNDDFSSIVHGIHEGRIIYSNIRKVIFLLVSTGAAEIVLFILSMVAGLPMPLVAVQLLWLNLVTNGIQHIGLSFEPAEGNELQCPPRNPKEPIFNQLMLQRVLLSALFMGAVAFGLYYWLLRHGYSVDTARNYVLLLMVMLENVQALNSRSETRSIFRQRFFSNLLLVWSVILAQGIHIACMYIPGISHVLHLAPVTFMEWGVLLLISCSLLSLDELFRLWNKARK